MDIGNVSHFNPMPNVGNAPMVPSEGVRATEAEARERLVFGGVSGGLAPIDGAEDVPESALRRDDPLGKLVSGAFNLPAPPAPAFTDGGIAT